MASYSTVRRGDSGSDVKALQEALNSAGYSLDVDGIFGSKTQAAVRDYQASQGLTVDGIVGKNTWGALTSAPSSPSSGSDRPSSSAASDALSKQLESLIAQFNSTPGYTPKTEEEIREQAQGEYESYYDQLRLAAQQAQEKSDLALAQQREQLSKSYDAQREASEKEYASAYSQADRQMLSRGMQRSSYAAQTLANIDTQGAQAQQAIADAQTQAETAVDEQRTLLAQQLAAQLAQYDAGEAADVLNRIRELEDQEYERGMQATDRKNSLSAQIYDLMYQAERDKVADQQWQQEFEESVRQFDVSASKKSSSGGSRSSSSSAAAATTPTTNTASGIFSSFSNFVSALSGTAKTVSSSVKAASSPATGSGGKLGTTKTDEKGKKI